jgi:hypothetical protein
MTLGSSRFHIRRGRHTRIRIKVSSNAVHELGGKATVIVVLQLVTIGRGRQDTVDRIMTLNLRR